MRARALLAVELDDHGNSVIRRLRSAAPLTLMPATGHDHAVVRLVNSAAAPLAGDDLELIVQVGEGARLTIQGVAATLALPGHRFEPSKTTVRLTLAEHAHVEYLPEPTVVTGRARHESLLHAELAATAELRAREVLVLGRAGERPGSLRATTHVLRAGRPVLRQTLDIGDPIMQDSAAYLAGRRVLATEIMINNDVTQSCGGDWWSVMPLAGGGSLVTALAHDAVTSQRSLDRMRGGTPAGGNLQSQLPDSDLS